MASIKKAIKDLFKPDVIKFGIHARSISQWALASLRKQNIIMLELKDDLIMEYRGCRFKVDVVTCIPVLTVYDEYRFDRIRKGDVVLDIGAQIGAFAIPASKIAERVYAVEPIFIDELGENTELNNTEDKVICLNYGIGKSNRDAKLEYRGVIKDCQLIKFKELRNKVEKFDKVDFLKIDCEGSEWSIEPEDLKGIRTIEAELHTFNLWHIINVRKWERWLKKNNYEYELIRMDSTRYMLHAELR